MIIQEIVSWISSRLVFHGTLYPRSKMAFKIKRRNSKENLGLIAAPLLITRNATIVYLQSLHLYFLSRVVIAFPYIKARGGWGDLSIAAGVF
jgi:hypothetical protein